MSNAQNGARIKAWAGKNVGSGIVKNITFTGFVETNVDNPVVIDQCYMTAADTCKEFPSTLTISDVHCTPIFSPFVVESNLEFVLCSHQCDRNIVRKGKERCRQHGVLRRVRRHHGDGN